MIDNRIKLENKDSNTIWYVDCDRLMYDTKDSWQAKEISWGAMSPGSNGEHYLKTVCKHLGFNN